MAIAKIDTIDIPGVYTQRVSREEVADEGRTAGGKLRRDVVVAGKRIWRLETRVITTAQRNALVNHLESIMWGFVDFWLDEFGAESNTVRAKVEIEEDRPTQLPNLRTLTLTITEQ